MELVERFVIFVFWSCAIFCIKIQQIYLFTAFQCNNEDRILSDQKEVPIIGISSTDPQAESEGYFNVSIGAVACYQGKKLESSLKFIDKESYITYPLPTDNNPPVSISMFFNPSAPTSNLLDVLDSKTNSLLRFNLVQGIIFVIKLIVKKLPKKSFEYLFFWGRILEILYHTTSSQPYAERIVLRGTKADNRPHFFSVRLNQNDPLMLQVDFMKYTVTGCNVLNYWTEFGVNILKSLPYNNMYVLLILY